MNGKLKDLLSREKKIIEDLKSLIIRMVIFPEKYSVQDSEKARRLQNELKSVRMQKGRRMAMKWRKLLGDK